MARIRTMKPNFFRSHDIYVAELKANQGRQPANYLNLRAAFLALITVADREGRFKWNPAELKLDCLPYDAVDFSEVLDVLSGVGEPPMIMKYEIDGKSYGEVTGFKLHQIIPHTEPASEIPGPDGLVADIGRFPTDSLRRNIYRRDSYMCVYCGKDMRDQSRLLSLDHVIPVRHGGTHYDKNLVTACKVCNSAKGDRTPTEAGMAWPKGMGEKMGDSKSDTPLTECEAGVNDCLTRKGKEGKGKEGKEEQPCAGPSDEFESFWRLYPRKTARGAALKAWEKLRPDAALRARMAAAVAAQSRSAQWTKDGGQFVPHPATWINQKRWEDEAGPVDSGGRVVGGAAPIPGKYARAIEAARRAHDDPPEAA